MSMAFVIYHMAETYESYPLYEKFLYDLTILLRFNYIAKTHLVVALLAMGRDTEAYGTLKYYMLGNLVITFSRPTYDMITFN